MSTQQMQAVINAAQEDELNVEKLAERGVPLATAANHWVGYVHDTVFGGTCSVKFCFALPMFCVDGELLGLKLHRNFRSEGQGKAYWLFPADDCKTLFPPPEWKRSRRLPDDMSKWPEAWVDKFEANRDRCTKYVSEQFRDEFASWQAQKAFGAANPLLEHGGEWLFLCGGELKALAVVGVGLWATAPMTGESNFWTPELLARLDGLRVCILYDDDNQGRLFRDKTIHALLGHAAEIRVITFGTKADGSKIDANDVAASGKLKPEALRLLDAAETIDPETWKKEHEQFVAAGAAGVLPADLEALDKEYMAEDYKGYSRQERQEKYAQYLAKYPHAVSGDKGHNTLLVAVGHRHGFGVSVADAMLALRQYNARCQPPWSDDEIIHKLEDAKPLASYPQGCRLDDVMTENEMEGIVFVPK